MFKGLLLLSALGSLLGCVTLQTPATSAKIDLATSTTDTADTIKQKLKRSTGLKNSYYYYVDVFPLTEDFVALDSAEDSRKAMDNADQAKNRLADLRRLYVDKKSCFRFFIATNHLESSKFDTWVAKLETPDGKLQDITFSNLSGRDSIPFSNRGGQYPSWQNFSSGCTGKLDFAKGFKIRINNRVIPNSPETQLIWETN